MALTARAMTSSELALMRTPGQFSKLYLAIAKYNTIYTARLATVPASMDNVSQIAYNTGSGTLADVKAGMTLYVGSSAGADDIGRVRLRKAPDATYFYIAATSTIDWSAAATIYLTVKDDFALRMKPALWAATMKMDYEYAYSDQHSSFEPVPVMGPHEVLWLTGATVSAHFSASDSWVIGSTISSYLWVAPGASATANLNTANPTITYNAAGFYRVYCTVTAANGKTFMGARHVFVYSAAAMPATRFQIRESPRCDTSSGGWSFGVTMYDEAALADVRDGALAILFAEDWYGSTKQSAGPIANRENIIAIGWIAGESIQWDTNGGSVDFTVQGPAGWLKQTPIYIFDMKFKTSATKWNEMPNLNIQRALFDLCHWRTTITAIMDVKITDDARMTPNIQASRGNVWGQMEEIAKRIFARPGVDRYGRLFVEIDPQMTPEASRTWATVMTVTEADRVNGIALRKSTVPPVSLLPTSGWQTNSSGKAVTLYSLAMGHLPLEFGNMESPIDKLLVTDQTQANEMAGLALGWKNNEWPDAPIGMPQNNRFIDCWPNQFIAATLDAADSPRGEGFSGNLIPRAVELTWDPAVNALGLNMTCEAETFATLAITGDAPSTGGEVTTPPTDPPIPPPIDPGDIPPEGPTHAIISTGNFGFLWTETLHLGANAAWYFMNNGLPTYGTPSAYVVRIKRAPSGAIFAGMADVYDNWIMKHLYWAPGPGGVWSMLLDRTTAALGANGFIQSFGVNEEAGESVLAMAGVNEASFYAYVGSRAGLTQAGGPMTISKFSADVSWGMGKWFLVGVNGVMSWATFSAAGGVLTPLTNMISPLTSGTPYLTYRGGGKVFLPAQSGGVNKLRVIPNNASTGSDPVYTLPWSFGQEQCRFAVDAAGSLLMGGDSTHIGQRSSDGGATWGNIGTGGGGGMTVGYSRWFTIGGWWFAATTQKLLRSNDFGDTWEDCSGNLATLAPSAAITGMVVWA